MAAGRRHYALETLAHRDGYTIKDVDNIDGLAVGSHRWLAEGCPSVLEAGWDSSDVLDRWRRELENDEYVREAARGNIEALNKIPDVRLSTDAGRFLCDFIFYESLSLRWKDARRQRGELQSLYENYPTSPPQPGIDEEEHGRSREREGKVAFLHVPGDTDSGAIERGVRVTEGAIRALVASWEGGYRRQSQERTGKVGVGFVS